jgi:hypothetical protein
MVALLAGLSMPATITFTDAGFITLFNTKNIFFHGLGNAILVA